MEICLGNGFYILEEEDLKLYLKETNIQNFNLVIHVTNTIQFNVIDSKTNEKVGPGIIDVYNDTKWVELVKSLVNATVLETDKIGLIGHFKDDSSYYLKLFQEWQMVELDSLVGSISATPLREAYYRGEIYQVEFPLGTAEFLEKFQKTEIYQQLKYKYQTQDKSNL